LSRLANTGATCLAPYMKRMIGTKTGALATSTIESPGSEVPNRETSAGIPPASRENTPGQCWCKVLKAVDVDSEGRRGDDVIRRDVAHTVWSLHT
jgi:hypothetical protein